MNNWRDIISGGLSGVIEVSTTHWIDNIKTKIQQNKLEGKKMTRSYFTFQNLYRGYYPRLIGIIPMRLVFWSSQTVSNSYLSDKNLNNKIKLLMAGAFCGGCQTIIDNPIETLKVQMMTSNHNKINNFKLTKSNIYTGFYPTFYRNILFASVFNTYLNSKKMISVWERFKRGSVAGLIASVISQPLDVLKTESQRNGSSKKSMINVTIDICKKNPAHLFSGLTARAILSCCTMGVGFVSYTAINDIMYH